MLMQLLGGVIISLATLLQCYHCQCTRGFNENLEAALSWDRVDFVWPSREFRNNAIRKNGGSRDFGMPIGLRVFNDNVYMTIPRWNSEGFRPANLVVTGRPSNACTQNIERPSATTQLLRAYPDWKSQEVGDCSGFQYVQNLEVDQKGILWLPDNGWVGWKGARSACPPKIVLMDCKTNEIKKSYVFPKNVASHEKGTFLNDIALDVETGFAFISDSTSAHIIVYDSNNDKSWKIRHRYMLADNVKASTLNFVHAEEMPLSFPNNNVNGITLTPKTSNQKRYLVFSPLTSYSLFYAHPEDLRKNMVTDSTFGVLNVTKPSQSDGLVMDTKGRLYFSAISKNALYFMDTMNDKREFPAKDLKIQKIVQDNTTLIWPDSLAIDNDGDFLWATTRGWPLDKHRNYLIRVPIGRLSYQYS